MVTAKAESGWLDRPLSSILALDVEKLLYVVLLVAAFATRFFDLGTRVMSHDESLHTYYSYQLYTGRGFVHTPLMHGPLQFHLLALSYYIFGDSDFTARIPAALFGVAAVGLIYFFRGWLGRAGALVAAALVVASPYMLYYARYTRNEAFVVVWALLAAWASFRYLESREPKWLYLLTGASVLHSITKETSFIYIAIWLVLLDLLLLRDLFAAGWARRNLRRAFELLVMGGLAGLAIAGLVLAAGHFVPGMFQEVATITPANPDMPPQLGEGAPGGMGAADRIGLIAMAVGLLLFTLAHLLALLYFGNGIRRFAVFDLLIVQGTFVLPMLTAFPVRWLGGDPIDYSTSQMWQTGLVFAVLMTLSVAVGIAWDWQKWLVCAGIWFGIFIPIQTTIFTNAGGFWTGMVGSLGYWLVQQGVERGSQPWYYYIFVQLPTYEFLPVMGALTALGYGVADSIRAGRPGPATEEPDLTGNALAETGGGSANGPDLSKSAPAIGFIAGWGVLMIVALSIAGEKMPWLTVHLTLPLILLSGWAVGRLIDSVDWDSVWHRRGWLMAVLLPVLLTSFAFIAVSLLGVDRPFAGKTLDQLLDTSAFLSAAVVAAIAGTGIYVAGRESGWKHLGRLAGLVAFAGLLLVTTRAAFAASYVRYDDASEFLVYAHSATGVKTVMNQVAEISERMEDGDGVRVAYDDDVSWPMTWYMREFPNAVFYGDQPTRAALDSPLVIAGNDHWDDVEPLLGERYHSFEYIRMWWPMQEYWNLDKEPERIRTALASPEYRQAIWDIWWNRDYTRYGELTGVDYSLERWPVVDRMRFYIRKDIAAQIWDYGIGPSVLAEAEPADPYEAGRQTLAAGAVWGGEGTGPGQFSLPRDVAVAPDGTVYVADTFNHQVQKFDAAGNHLLTFGGPSGSAASPAPTGTFNEPWGIAVGPDGSVYVSDTWNHRVQKFSPEGEFINAWGVFGQAETPQSFWGPRGIAVDERGRVFLADTGNKRILIFDGDGGYLSTVGLGGGYLPGYLDEPTGVAVGPDGRLYVADAWNRRVQVFTEDPATGEFLYSSEWEVAGWYGQSLDNKPDIAVDGTGRVFVSDPEGFRIVAFDSAGNFITTWGDFGATDSTFALPAGVGASPDGWLFVTDARNHRVMMFEVP